MILYEFPLNERIRTLLRLEDLFARFLHFSGRPDPMDHHAALTTLFEILEVTLRADLRSDLLQELERQRQALLLFRDDPGVSFDALAQVLREIDSVTQQLGAMSGKAGAHLRDNEWLNSIRGRVGIAGGTCEFDLPAYHAWMHRPAEARKHDIDVWTAPFKPLQGSLAIVLSLLRESARKTPESTSKGSFQQTLSGKGYQMLQIRLEAATGAIPEISANKHMLWIRFTSQGGDLRPRPFEGDVSFELALCNL